MTAKDKKFSFGPGFLVTAAFIGPGTVTTCSLAGAQFGYALIYALVFATVTTVILQEMTGRLSLGSGRDLGQSLREYSDNPLVKMVLVLLTLSAITLGCAAYEAGNIIGGALGLEMISPIPQRAWVALISAMAGFILWRRQYALIEKVLIFLVFLMSFAFLATFILIKPDLASILRGLVPRFPESSVILVLALVGTTVVPYNLFLHSSTVKKKWQTPGDLKSVKKDLLIAVGLGGMISASIIVTSAVAFFEKGLKVEQGVQMAQQLQPLFGPFTTILFGAGLFAAGMSSAITAPYAAAFASSGILGWKDRQNSWGFRGVWLGVLLVGLVVSMFGFKPLSVIIFAQAANGIILPVASIFLLVVLNDRKKMGALANNWKQNLLGGLIILVVSCLGIWNIVRLFIA